MIAILAMLAALGTVGIMRALDSAKQSRIKIELDNIDAALKAYKDRYGSFPPSDITTANMSAVAAHVARAFPRYNLGANYANLQADLTAAGLSLGAYRPDQALVFWLRGFSPDVTHPFVKWRGNNAIQLDEGTETTSVQVTPLFDFDQTRLKLMVPTAVTDPAASYIPPGVKDNVPYVYFNAASYGPIGTPEHWDSSYGWDRDKSTNLSYAGFPTPYIYDENQNRQLDVGVEDFVNPDTYQLIACGLDGRYGTGNNALPAQRLYPTGLYYDSSATRFVPWTADDDNLTNFCEKARLGDAKP